uniref:Pentacotripeptide-repeat region of PRORP domain-containing protein n=1 Tax=Dendroctonus ponderosae TaxID=77166 RepID=A0AAR5QHY9_DENPD
MQRINNAFVQYLRSNSFKNYRSPIVSVSVLYHRLNRCFSQAVKNYPSPNGISDKKRFNVEDLIQYVNTGKVFYLKQLINVYPTIEFDKLNSEQAKLLLELCGSSVVDSSCDQRNALCQKLYEDMTQVNKVTIDVLNRYIKTCTENKHLVPCEELLGKWSSDVDTYKLLFENASEVGAMSDMFKILELMKQQNIGLDGDIVKHLVLGHVIQGGLKSAHTVLSTLRSAQIFENNDVKLAIFKGLIRRGNYMEFKKAVEIYPIQLTGDQLLSFIEEMGLNGLESWLAEIKGFYSHVPISRTFQIDVERLCIHLIHMDQPVAAMNIYAQFVGLRPNVSFGWSLLKEMLHSEILIRKQRLKVANQSAYTLQDICKPFITTTVQKEFDSIIASLVDLALNLPDSSSIIHPKNMNLDELECHLIELREKNMEIRGVLRKLIQLHAGNGNVQRLKELRELFRQSGYTESAGMKSAIMHSYIVGEQLDEAINLYDELKLSHPDFKLDNNKIIDLVKLLVENNRFSEGVSIINEQSSKSKQAGNIQAIQRNCRALLKACKTEEQVEEMFALLMKNGLCVACNVTLGPLIEICLKTGQTGKAVERYIELSQKYKCTPFQLEILKAVSKEQNSAVLDRLLKATEAVHGSAAAQLGLIAALAENGQQNALRNALLNMTRPIDRLLEKRCARWAEERKLEPLQCLANASSRLKHSYVDIDVIHNSIIDIYDINNDCDGALAFFDSVSDEKSSQLAKRVEEMRNKSRAKI